MTAPDRVRRSDEADDLCSAAFRQARCPERGVSLVAVGGYGRRELAPHSDLDVVLLIDEPVETGAWATDLWYPLWDSGRLIDHSVRTPSQVLTKSGEDLRVAMGMLDLRHLAGDPNLTLRVRSSVLNQWRRDARLRLPELRELAESRAERFGELGHVAVPDLKESVGGLRDVTALRALVASWLVDIPHQELGRWSHELLDVRDVLHQLAGRATDRVIPEYWEGMAVGLELADAQAAQMHTREIGRRLAHLSRLIWRRAEAVLRRPSLHRRPQLQALGGGVAVAAEEVILDRHARPDQDPLRLLRAAAEASQGGLVLAPNTSSNLARMAPELPTPWPDQARDLFVRMLAGPGLLGVWETLEATGALARILPEWERIRLLPHASVVHRFTVDRHLVETCREASRLIRRVGRPDVLLVSALLHDIGKGQEGEHSVTGMPIAEEIATRMGFDGVEVKFISQLVRWHLLLPEIALSRDLDDPATIEQVVQAVGDSELLELLVTLTEADARATSPKAWSPWRATMITALGAQVRRVLAEPQVGPHLPETAPPAGNIPKRSGELLVEDHGDGSTVIVTASDRSGLLADVAALFALHRIQVRAARIWTEGEVAISVWEVAATELDPALLRQRLKTIIANRGMGQELAPAERSEETIPPEVLSHPGASTTASVLEIRSHDRLGLVHTVCQTLSGVGINIRSAHLSTFGPQAVDVFYLEDPAGGKLDPDQLQRVRGLLVKALASPGSG